MSWQRHWAHTLRNLFRKPQLDRELDAELRFHVEKQTEENLRRGMTREEARRLAMLELGGVEQIKEQVRETRSGFFLDTLWQDLRNGARMLRKNPGFTFVAVLTLTLGIGANTAIFSVVHAVLLRPLPFAEPDRLVTFRSNQSAPELTDIEAQNRSFESLGGIVSPFLDYLGAAEPLQIQAGAVTDGYFRTLGVGAALGRVLGAGDNRLGGEAVAVLSHRFWMEHFAGSPAALGKTLALSGQTYTIVGVMPASFESPRERPDLFVPLLVALPEAAPHRGVHFLRVYARLKPGVTPQAAQSEMRILDEWMGKEFPAQSKGRETRLIGLLDRIVGNVRLALWILFGAVGLVLLIACSNFGGLLLARGAARQQEMSIRAAMGASRARLVRQMLTESTLIALAGGGMGLVLAWWSIDLLRALEPADLPRLASIHVDGTVLGFTLGLSLLAGILFGVVPAWQSVHGKLGQALKDGSRATAGALPLRLRAGLVVTEIALSLVLLVGAGLLIESFLRLRGVDPGFDPEQLLTLRIQLPESRYRERKPQMNFQQQLLAALNSLPGTQAAMISEIPLGGDWLTHNFVIADRPPVPRGDEPELQTRSVRGDYFNLMRIPILQGRDLTPLDHEGAPLVGVVNESFVRQYFPAESPLGARVRWASLEPPQWISIVGVVGDTKHFGLHQPEEPALYTPYEQAAVSWKRWMNVVIRSSSAPGPLAGAVRAELAKQDAQLPVTRVRTMQEVMARSLAERRFNMLLLGVFAGTALVLAAVGLYGLMSYAVRQRTHEIGIRVALGAQQGQVLRLVLSQSLRLTGLGLALGILAAVASTRLIAGLLFEIAPTDPATFVFVAFVLLVAALLASILPARRAMRVDPMVALRYE